MKYYCDGNVCSFNHEGWCAYWDSTIELMHIRKKLCPMNFQKCEAIDAMMEE